MNAAAINLDCSIKKDTDKSFKTNSRCELGMALISPSEQLFKGEGLPWNCKIEFRKKYLSNEKVILQEEYCLVNGSYFQVLLHSNILKELWKSNADFYLH